MALNLSPLRIKSLWVAIALFASAAHAETAGKEKAPPVVEESDATSKEHAQCVVMSRMFYRLAEQRDSGVTSDIATFRITQWLGQLGDTGSHIKVDYRKAVAPSTKFVFQHTKLNPASLAHYGYRSCKMQQTFAADELRRNASMMMLLDATSECQSQHPGIKHNNKLRECVKEKSREITERVRTARIEP